MESTLRPCTLDWGPSPEYQVVLRKLSPLRVLRQVKAGRKFGLAWDVFVQAAATKVMGMITYHTGRGRSVWTFFAKESNFNDGTTQTARDPYG
jgi:hypothetical protein